jgi:hypothetical protein
MQMIPVRVGARLVGAAAVLGMIVTGLVFLGWRDGTNTEAVATVLIGLAIASMLIPRKEWLRTGILVTSFAGFMGLLLIASKLGEAWSAGEPLGSAVSWPKALLFAAFMLPLLLFSRWERRTRRRRTRRRSHPDRSGED